MAASRGPNAIALAYTARALVILGGSTRQLNFAVSDDLTWRLSVRSGSPTVADSPMQY